MSAPRAPATGVWLVSIAAHAAAIALLGHASRAPLPRPPIAIVLKPTAAPTPDVVPIAPKAVTVSQNARRRPPIAHHTQRSERPATTLAARPHKIVPSPVVIDERPTEHHDPAPLEAAHVPPVGIIGSVGTLALGRARAWGAMRGAPDPIELMRVQLQAHQRRQAVENAATERIKSIVARVLETLDMPDDAAAGATDRTLDCTIEHSAGEPITRCATETVVLDRSLTRDELVLLFAQAPCWRGLRAGGVSRFAPCAPDAASTASQ